MKSKDTVLGETEMASAIIANPDFPMGEAIAEKQAEVSFKAGQKQARWEVGGELCCLIGNIMLKDMEAGKLLGEQLKEYMKHYLKEYGEVKGKEPE